MINLIDILKELYLSDHYLERKEDRVTNIIDINVSKEALGNFSLSDIKQPLIDHLQNELNKRLKILEPQDIPLSNRYRIGYKIFIPVINYNNKRYPIIVKTKEGIGTYYYVIIKDNTLVTLIVSDAEDFAKEIAKHSERKLQGDPIQIINYEKAIYDIDLNQLMGVEIEKEKIISPEKEIPYNIRTDYRVGATFKHNKYGEGTIVATSSGNRGIADQRGIIDWVDIDFKTPYLSGGKVQTIRRIPSVYAKTYFDYPLE